MDDFELAAAIAKGDQGAIRALFEAHFDALFRFLRQLTRHVEDAEDLAQQTLIRVIKSAAKYDGRASMRSWTFAFAYREYGRWQRRKAWLPLPWHLPAKTDLAAETVNASLLLDALEKLSTAHRAAFLLHYVEGLSVEEVGIVQGVPAGTVKSRLHFARTQLRGTLEQEEFYVTESRV